MGMELLLGESDENVLECDSNNGCVTLNIPNQNSLVYIKRWNFYDVNYSSEKLLLKKK
jgi:hypothetical protein